MQLYRLNDDVFSMVKGKDKYAEKGELVKVVSLRENVIIVEVVIKKGNEITKTGRTFATVMGKLTKVL